VLSLTPLLATVPALPQVLDPLHAVDIADLHGFWIQKLINTRFLVLYFLPLLPILFFAPLRIRRPAIIATGAAFLVYVFGAILAAFYLISCIAFFRLAERFAIESRRTDVIRWGPPLAAILIISIWYQASQKIFDIAVPPAAAATLFEYAPWLFPIGQRGFSWEPLWRAPTAVPFPFAAFLDPHLIGTAYLAVRMLHYYSEVRRDGIPQSRRNLPDFLAWLFFAPSLMQGPIARYTDFQDQLPRWNAQRSPAAFAYGLWRIAWGVAKAIVAHIYLLPVVVQYFLPRVVELPAGGRATLSPFYHQPETIPGFWFLYFGVAIHFAWLYLEFSGYCDVAIGMSRLLGFRLLENFDWVWISRSLREFWRRWHISLSLILRDYIYIPLGGNRAPLRNLVLTFVICGLWHRWIPSMWQWGLLMGAMVWLNQRWVDAIKRIESRPDSLAARVRAAWIRVPLLPQLAAWALTMHAFFLSILVFFAGVEGLAVVREIFLRIGRTAVVQ
jgi:D-alanyl-lipoteichoic acid acyltransferase DltB (MBOAT superfamily)